MSAWPAAIARRETLIIGPTRADGQFLYHWVLDSSKGDDEWTWGGPLTIAATLPAPSALPRFISNGEDTFLYRVGSGPIDVVRKVNGLWVSDGQLPLTSAPASATIRLVGDTAVALLNSQIVIVRRTAPSQWEVIKSMDPPAGASWTSTGSQFSPYFVVAPEFIAVGLDVQEPLWESLGRFAVQIINLPATGEPTLGPTITSPEPGFRRLGQRLSAAGKWLAVGGSTTVEPNPRVYVFERQADGSFALALRTAPSSDLLNGISELGRLNWQSSSPWVRGPDRVWRPSAWRTSLAVYGDPAGSYSTVLSATLRVWEHPEDSDLDGVQDAYAIASGLVEDCNRNGQPDGVDLATGLLPDINANGLPDACEADCDANGVADLAQLRDGASTDCEDPNTLAACAILAGAPDVNRDGVVDTCGPDLNQNGVPDAVEIASGSAVDCNGDGVPDDAPAYQMSREDYFWVHFPSTSGALWASGFPTKLDQRWVTQIEIPASIGTDAQGTPQSPIGRPFLLMIVSDPNGDFSPADGELLWSTTGVWEAGNSHVVDVPHVEIPAESFIVAVTTPPGTFDNGGWSTGNGYMRGGPGINLPVQDFTSEGFQSSASYWIGGDLPEDPFATLTAASSLGAAFAFRVHTQTCPILGDLDRDGTVNGKDLALLLDAWGTVGDSPADLDHSGVVNGADLGILLTVWNPGT